VFKGANKPPTQCPQTVIDGNKDDPFLRKRCAVVSVSGSVNV
jgi:hypothetical protein